MGKGKQRAKGRAYLKVYSAGYINAGQGIDKRYTDQFKNSKRSMGKIHQGPNIDLQSDGRPLLPKIIHADAELPQPRHHYTEAGHYIPGTSPQRRKVELEIRKLKLEERINMNWTGGQRHQKVETLPRVLIHKFKYSKIWMYYGTEHFVFVEETLTEYRGSITYSNRARAMRALEATKRGDPGGITWVETQDKETADDQGLRDKT